MTRAQATAIIEQLQDAQAALYGDGGPAAVRDVLTADVEWVVPGDSPIAGHYRGIEEVIAYMLRRGELAGGSFG